MEWRRFGDGEGNYNPFGPTFVGLFVMGKPFLAAVVDIQRQAW